MRNIRLWPRKALSLARLSTPGLVNSLMRYKAVAHHVPHHPMLQPPYPLPLHRLSAMPPLSLPLHTHPTRLRALTPKLLCPIRVLCQIVTADCRPAALDRLDKVAHAQRRLEQLVAVEVGPGFFHGLRVAGRAGCPFCDIVDLDLRVCVS